MRRVRPRAPEGETGMSLRFWLRYKVERAAWEIGTWLREWACVSAGGEHDYLSEPFAEDTCLVCGHVREEPR